MAAVGGSIESVSLNGRLFPVAADADANRSLGGFTNDVAANGDGTARILKTRVAWTIGGLSLECDDTRSDQEFLKSIADGLDFVNCTITFVSGFTYQGTAIITDKLEFSSAKSTVDVTLMGPGDLSQQ